VPIKSPKPKKGKTRKRFARIHPCRTSQIQVTTTWNHLTPRSFVNRGKKRRKGGTRTLSINKKRRNGWGKARKRREKKGPKKYPLKPLVPSQKGRKKKHSGTEGGGIKKSHGSRWGKRTKESGNENGGATPFSQTFLCKGRTVHPKTLRAKYQTEEKKRLHCKKTEGGGGREKNLNKKTLPRGVFLFVELQKGKRLGLASTSPKTKFRKAPYPKLMQDKAIPSNLPKPKAEPNTSPSHGKAFPKNTPAPNLGGKKKTQQKTRPWEQGRLPIVIGELKNEGAQG